MQQTMLPLKVQELNKALSILQLVPQEDRQDTKLAIHHPINSHQVVVVEVLAQPMAVVVIHNQALAIVHLSLLVI
jgi:hypothetical protein